MPQSTHPDTPDHERLSREADLWVVEAGKLTDESLLDSYRRLLSTDEQARYQRFRDRQARLEFLIGRALTRTTLSRYLPIEPTDWAFQMTAQGRPEIAGPAEGQDLRFNLSHSQGLIACLVTLSMDSGVDVEFIDRKRQPLELAGQVFSAAEESSLLGLPPSQQRHLFHSYWTLKEAYLKAQGAGLSFGLRRISFSLSDPGQIAVSFDPDVPDREANWQFGLYRWLQHHLLAVAIRREKKGDFKLRARQVVPLTDQIEDAALDRLASSPPNRHSP